ncbi:hypothetical protein ACHAXS_012198 [Conticribra weissflogii]
MRRVIERDRCFGRRIGSGIRGATSGFCGGRKGTGIRPSATVNIKNNIRRYYPSLDCVPSKRFPTSNNGITHVSPQNL